MGTDTTLLYIIRISGWFILDCPKIVHEKKSVSQIWETTIFTDSIIISMRNPVHVLLAIVPKI